MMIQLQGHSLTAQRVLHPETFALNLSERDSTATITLPPDAPEIVLGDWLQDTEEPGAGIVWRVKTNDAQINAGQRTHSLEHMVRSLADRILGEVYPEDMSGEELTPAEKKTAVCTVRQALEYILALQEDWTLGDLDPVYEEISKPYHFNGDTLLAALETVSGSLEDPLWTYDFSVYPFRLNILHIPETVGCEMRSGRNITTLKITEDRTRLYTRIYPIGKNNLRLPDPGYLSQNEQLYGVVEKTETDQSQETEEQLAMWAQERLSRHCEPSVTVTISGLDLSESTGEPLDKLTIGKRCRVPLPSNGSVILEKVTKLAWRDKVKEKESVTVTLANALEDVQSILRQERNAAGKHGRTSAKQNQDYILVIGGVESGLYTRVAQTASEIRQEAHREAESMRTLIYQTASELRIQAQADKQGLQTLISQTASEIRTEAASDKESLRSLISQTASSWSAKISGVTDANGNVTAASIAVAINNSTGQSEAKIDAQKVYIGSEQSTTVIAGKALATDLAATDAKIENISIIEGQARYVSSGKVYATSSLSVGNGVGSGAGTFYYRGTLYNPNYIVLKDKDAANLVEATFLGTAAANNSVNLTHYHEISVEEGTGDLAGKMVVTLGAPRATEGTANFKIADTQTYINGVSAARTAGKNDVTLSTPVWTTTPAASISGNSNTVTVSTSGRPTQLDRAVQLFMNQGSWSGGSKYVYVTHTDSQDANRVARLSVSIGSWSYGNISHASSKPTDGNKEYTVNSNYNYASFTVTVAGQSRKIVLTII